MVALLIVEAALVVGFPDVSDPPVTPEGPTKPADDIELLSSKDFLTPEASP
jgi:hypothetical protein